MPLRVLAPQIANCGLDAIFGTKHPNRRHRLYAGAHVANTRTIAPFPLPWQGYHAPAFAAAGEPHWRHKLRKRERVFAPVDSRPAVAVRHRLQKFCASVQRRSAGR